MRRTLQITMLILSFVPFSLGVMNLVNGAAQFLPSNEIFPEIDSQLRFYSVWFMFPLFITIWIVRNLDIAGPVLMISFGTMALGGLARIYSMLDVGMPDPVMVGATAVEIATLLFIPWHRAVIRRDARAASA